MAVAGKGRATWRLPPIGGQAFVHRTVPLRVSALQASIPNPELPPAVLAACMAKHQAAASCWPSRGR